MSDGTARDSVITEVVRKAIGTWCMPCFPPEDVTNWAILRYIAATSDPNPLWRDDAYSQNTRWGGVIAPPTFIDIYSPQNRQWRELSGGQLPVVHPVGFPYVRTFLGSEEFEFYDPIRPGDAARSKCVLEEVSERESGSGRGRLVFSKYDITYYNQLDVLVTRQKYTFVSVESPPLAAQARRREVPEGSAVPAATSPKQLYFEDIEVGAPIPPMDKSITFTTLLKFGGATGTMGLPHFDFKYMTRVLGMSDVIAHGELSCAYLAQLITNWIGGWGVFKKHLTQCRGNVFPGDIITFGGRVADKYTRHGEGTVECDTRAENQHGEIVSLGKSTVTLPSKG
ncbi:MaoC family dehydratase [Chloroflexota bacterium]